MNSWAVNPLGFAYSSVTGISQYGKHTGMLITGRSNPADPAFAAARAAGAEVLAYFDPCEVPVTPLPGLDAAFYEKAQAWPQHARANYPGTILADINVGSPWSNSVVQSISALMTTGSVDGVFLDVLGARLWSVMTDWGNWPITEQDAWTAGCVSLIQRLDAARRQLNPNFILVNNNTWDRGDADGLPGEACVNGVCLEHSDLNAYHTTYAAKPFCGFKRRLLVIAKSTTDAQSWAQVDGVTHVSDQQNYAQVNPPQLPFMRLDYSRVP